MHDPMTVAFELGRFATIWHVDPETDGSDDSCGWSYPKLTKEQRERIRNAAWSEGRIPYFLRCRDKHWRGTRYEAESLYRGLVLLVADILEMRMSYDEAGRIAARRIHQPDYCDAADDFCFLPGYHTNFADDEAEEPPYEGMRLERRQDHFAGVMCGIARELLRIRRPWYRRPRWHFWHWKIQIHPLLKFKRWAFSRCCKCGKGFRWGESPVSNSWNGTGPLWFRSEQNIHHSNCCGSTVAQSDTH